jgi:transposase InsO family protein
MKEKSKTLSKFKELKEKVESDIDKRIQYLYTDNEREYVSHEFNTYLKKHKIQRQLTYPNTLQQNDVA